MLSELINSREPSVMSVVALPGWWWWWWWW